MLVFGVLLFLGVRALMRRQAQRMNGRIEESVTPENARIAVKQLDDEQHREVYRAIAAEDGRRALTLYRQYTGASIQDCIIAVQALHTYPQPAPSEIRLEEELGGADTLEAVDSASGTSADPRDAPVPQEDAQDDEGESVEDMIDGVRDEVSSEGPNDLDSGDQEGPIAEADPNTGEILGENTRGVPDIPGGQDRSDAVAGDGPEDVAPADDGELDERARRLMEESGFNPDEELTIPEEWAQDDEEMAGFHLEVQRGDEKITLSHEDLEPWVHDQIYALLRDDHVDEAAQLLSDHSPLTVEEAHKFLVVFKNQG